MKKCIFIIALLLLQSRGYASLLHYGDDNTYLQPKHRLPIFPTLRLSPSIWTPKDYQNEIRRKPSARESIVQGYERNKNIIPISPLPGISWPKDIIKRYPVHISFPSGEFIKVEDPHDEISKYIERGYLKHALKRAEEIQDLPQQCKVLELFLKETPGNMALIETLESCLKKALKVFKYEGEQKFFRKYEAILIFHKGLYHHLNSEPYPAKSFFSKAIHIADHGLEDANLLKKFYALTVEHGIDY